MAQFAAAEAAEAAIAAAEDAGVMSDSILRRFGFDDIESLLWTVRNVENSYWRTFTQENFFWYRQSNAGAWLRDAENTLARRYPINSYFAEDGTSIIHKLFDPRAPGTIGGLMRGGRWVARWMGRNILPPVAAAEGLYAAYEHGQSLHTPSNTQDPYVPTPTTPAGPAVAPDQDIITGSADHGHSFLGAQSMPFGNASYGGRLGGRSGFKSGYPANQSRRQTEEFGDLNAHNRVFQFYNYHGEKKQMLDEYCRGLILSLLRIQKGTVLDYEEPIAWPYPVYHENSTAPVDGVESHNPLLPGLDMHLDYLEFHFKDNRRGTGTFGKTMTSAPLQRLAKQYRADTDTADTLSTCVSLWGEIPGSTDPNSPDRRMKSIQELARDMADMFQGWVDLGEKFIDPVHATIDDLDFVPVRVMLIKRVECNVRYDKVLAAHEQNGNNNVTPTIGKMQTYDVVYDDDQLGSSRVDVGCFTTITLHNVSPAAGDIVSNPDPLTADTINHVPLVGKMYTFSGPVPKVWDKHRDDLHELFNPSFFEIGRYRLPKSKLENLEEFKSPPRGRAIWSNCIGESRIMIGPGQIKKLRMNFRVRCSFAEFWQKYRNQYLADTKLGRCVCICLEPMIRRQHVGEPIPRQLMKTREPNATGDAAVEIQKFIDVPPYEFQLSDKSLEKPTKVLRKLFTFSPLSVAPFQGVKFWYHKYRLTDEGKWTKLKQHTGLGGAGTDHDIDVDGYAIYAGPPVDAASHTPFDHGSYHLVGEGLINPLQDNQVDPQPAAERWGHHIPDGVGLVAGIGQAMETNAIGVWPAPWTAHVSGTAVGDPMMFNVQINRLLTGRTWLKKKHILGADKSGIKRKWSERLTGNLGSVAMFNEDGTLNPDFKADAPRDIDMLPGAGVPAIIPQGEEGNITVQATGAGGGGLTQAQAKAAFVGALTDATVLQEHGHSMHPLSGITINSGKIAIDQSSHPLAGVVTNNKVQVDAGALTLAAGQTVGVTGTVGLHPGTAVPVSVGNATVPVSVGQAAVPVSVGNATIPVSVGGASVPVNNHAGVTVGVTPGSTVGVTGSVPVSVGNATVPVSVGQATVPVSVGQATVPVSVGQATVPIDPTSTVPIDSTSTVPIDPASRVPIDSTSTVPIDPTSTVQLASGGTVDVNIDSVNGQAITHESVPVDIRRHGETKVRTDENTGNTQYRYAGFQWRDDPPQQVEGDVNIGQHRGTCTNVTASAYPGTEVIYVEQDNGNSSVSTQGPTTTNPNIGDRVYFHNNIWWPVT